MRLRAALIIQISSMAILREDYALLETQLRTTQRMTQNDTRGNDTGEEGSGVSIEVEASLAAADMVICRVACISDNAYWRVHDHCKRTGKQCVLVKQERTIE